MEYRYELPQEKPRKVFQGRGVRVGGSKAPVAAARPAGASMPPVKRPVAAPPAPKLKYSRPQPIGGPTAVVHHEKADIKYVAGKPQPTKPEDSAGKPTIPLVTGILDANLQPVGKGSVAGCQVFMSMLPGVNKAKTNPTKVVADLERIKQLTGIDTIVCLVNRYEMRANGVDYDTYLAVCKRLQIEVVAFEIIEMGAPTQPPPAFDQALVARIIERLKAGRKIAVHCRAGVGRAGLVASCLLMSLGIFPTPEQCMKYLRTIRHPNCVESDVQRRYLVAFANYLGQEAPAQLIKAG